MENKKYHFATICISNILVELLFEVKKVFALNLDSNFYYLSDDAIETGYSYAQQYDWEIDLTNAFITSLLGTGHNNLSFAVLGIPHNYTGTDSYTYNDSMSFISFSADIMQNTESILGGGR
ncbi:MAG: hypothetical protein LBF88_09860 [Planctomycetaceae bacterium]|nr:hypothetical protein [Planctomycetaceae bacterium]